MIIIWMYDKVSIDLIKLYLPPTNAIGREIAFDVAFLTPWWKTIWLEESFRRLSITVNVPIITAAVNKCLRNRHMQPLVVIQVWVATYGWVTKKQTNRIIATRVMVQQATHIGTLWLAPFVDWYSWPWLRVVGLADSNRNATRRHLKRLTRNILQNLVSTNSPMPAKHLCFIQWCGAACSCPAPPILFRGWPLNPV